MTKEHFNFNTVLLGIVLALAGWTLKEVNTQGREFASMREKVSSVQREQDLQRIKVATNSDEIVLLKIRLATLRSP